MKTRNQIGKNGNKSGHGPQARKPSAKAPTAGALKEKQLGRIGQIRATLEECCAELEPLAALEDLEVSMPAAALLDGDLEEGIPDNWRQVFKEAARKIEEFDAQILAKRAAKAAILPPPGSAEGSRRALALASNGLWNASLELAAVLHAAAIHYNTLAGQSPTDEAAALKECGKDWPSLSCPVRTPSDATECNALGLAFASGKTREELRQLAEELADRFGGHLSGEPAPLRGLTWDELRQRITSAGRRAVLLANMTADGFLNAVVEVGPEVQQENAQAFVALAWETGNSWRAAFAAFETACTNCATPAPLPKAA